MHQCPRLCALCERVRLGLRWLRQRTYQCSHRQHGDGVCMYAYARGVYTLATWAYRGGKGGQAAGLRAAVGPLPCVQPTMRLEGAGAGEPLRYHAECMHASMHSSVGRCSHSRTMRGCPRARGEPGPAGARSRHASACTGHEQGQETRIRQWHGRGRRDNGWVMGGCLWGNGKHHTGSKPG